MKGHRLNRFAFLVALIALTGQACAHLGHSHDSLISQKDTENASSSSAIVANMHAPGHSKQDNRTDITQKTKDANSSQDSSVLFSKTNTEDDKLKATAAGSSITTKKSSEEDFKQSVFGAGLPGVLASDNSLASHESQDSKHLSTSFDDRGSISDEEPTPSIEPAASNERTPLVTVIAVIGVAVTSLLIVGILCCSCRKAAPHRDGFEQLGRRSYP